MQSLYLPPLPVVQNYWIGHFRGKNLFIYFGDQPNQSIGSKTLQPVKLSRLEIQDHLVYPAGNGDPMHGEYIPTGYLEHGNSMGDARGRSRHKRNSNRVVRNQEEKNVGTIFLLFNFFNKAVFTHRQKKTKI